MMIALRHPGTMAIPMNGPVAMILNRPHHPPGTIALIAPRHSKDLRHQQGQQAKQHDDSKTGAGAVHDGSICGRSAQIASAHWP